MPIRPFLPMLRTLAARWLYAIMGSFFVVAGWNWYHLPHRPHARFILISLAMWVGMWVVYQAGKWLFGRAARHFRRHPFWQEEFVGYLDRIFFLFSLFFLVFFSKNEMLSLAYVSLVWGVSFWYAERLLARHPAHAGWQVVNRTVFLLAYFIFFLEAILQYVAHRYYILDSYSRFFNIVVFRSVAMTSFWLAGFSIASLIYWAIKGRLRYAAMGLWSVAFILMLFFWSVNIGILYYSGLYLSPVALDHLRGSDEVVGNELTYVLLSLLAVVIIGFIAVINKFIRAHAKAPRQYWYYYHAVILVVAFLALFGLSSFKNTPERVVAKSFYERYFTGVEHSIELPGELAKKLERFGLFYDLNSFLVSSHERAFSSSSQKLLPERFQKQRPNIVILFLESFSSRLTDTYNPAWNGLTPRLKEMSDHPNTTIFKNYYNASTPTITGLISQLCSFLPPTGHEEIQNQKRLQRHHLLCLPEVLKNNGYGETSYITAVKKDFANKDSIFYSMGTDEVYGTDELKKYIPGEPLSWGYSDHQLFPALFNFMQEKNQSDKPFLMMLSTVDTHPPFNLAKDMVPYGDGQSPLLNSFHTTDHAFGKFWHDFQNSELAKNTIVVAVGDHAVFPAAFTKDLFPHEAGRLTYYDENFFALYIPNTVLPKTVELYSSGLDFAPTLLHVLGVNTNNSFEGHSLFDDRARYPNLVGMHELGLYINQAAGTRRKIDYSVPHALECGSFNPDLIKAAEPLKLCEFLHFYKWKRRMLEEGRLWNK